MRIIIKRAVAWAPSLLLMMCTLSGTLWAQSWPSRPVTLVVGFPPGGVNDIMARVVAEKLTATLGQPFIIDNRAGAGGTIGAALVARATPDGQTLLVGTVSNIVIAPIQYSKLTYDPLKDLIPVARIGTVPNALCVNPTLPVHTLSEFIAYAKSHKDAVNYASAGYGGTSHLTMELIKAETGIAVTHVSYKGDVPAMLGIIANEVAAGFSTLASALPQIQAGQLRPLGLSSSKRSPLLPDVPTLSESGELRDFDLDVWVGIFAPGGTPRVIIDRLRTEIAKIVKMPEVQKRLEPLGAFIEADTAEDFPAYLAKENEKWKNAAHVAGIKPE
jgi:tripartite-type tricarboxylate transporter receptor subunit TctC